MRTGKFTKKNWAALSLSVILLAVVFIYGLWDFDTNPAELEHIGKSVFVKNKNGRVLWKKTTFDYQPTQVNVFMNTVFQKLVDIDNDGINDVPIPISVAITISDDQAVVDFTKSAPQQSG